jgi:hypothetical protein
MQMPAGGYISLLKDALECLFCLALLLASTLLAAFPSTLQQFIPFGVLMLMQA